MTPNEPPPPPAAPSERMPSPLPRRFNWVCFLGMLVLPPLCSLVAAAAGLRDAAPFVALAGGGLAGVACGTLLGVHFGRTTAGRAVLGVLLSLVFVVVCISASSFGCLAGGYRLDFR